MQRVNLRTALGSSAVLGSFVRRKETGVAEEARTRGFAAPAFAGCAFVEDGLPMYGGVQEVSSSPSRAAWPPLTLCG
jgi:hypothetical protein